MGFPSVGQVHTAKSTGTLAEAFPLYPTVSRTMSRTVSSVSRTVSRSPVPQTCCSVGQPPPPPLLPKTRSDPHVRVGMCSGERPIGAPKGKRTQTMASCQTPLPPPKPAHVATYQNPDDEVSRGLVAPMLQVPGAPASRKTPKNPFAGDRGWLGLSTPTKPPGQCGVRWGLVSLLSLLSFVVCSMLPCVDQRR